jgi:hypothetical protein
MLPVLVWELVLRGIDNPSGGYDLIPGRLVDNIIPDFDEGELK